jgi:hypothetical protein
VVSPETRKAETEDALVVARPDRPATPDEEALADEEQVDDEVREHYQDMAERGVQERGEGHIP